MLERGVLARLEAHDGGVAALVGDNSDLDRTGAGRPETEPQTTLTRDLVEHRQAVERNANRVCDLRGVERDRTDKSVWAEQQPFERRRCVLRGKGGIASGRIDVKDVDGHWLRGERS